MTTLNALELRSIPSRPKYATFGYIHILERDLKIANIPTMICYLILEFLYNREYFEKAGEDLQISRDKMSITKDTWNISNREENMNTAYTKSWIEGGLKQIIRWSFIIEDYGYLKSLSDVSHIYIGIVSKDNRSNDTFLRKADKPWEVFYIRNRYGGTNDIHLQSMERYDLIFDTLHWKLSIQAKGVALIQKDIS